MLLCSKLNLFGIKVCTLKLTPLQSNRFRITYLKGNYNFKFKFTLETSKLGVFRLSESRLKRLELMNELSNRGYLLTQITNFLNINGIRTIRTNEKYSPKLVWTSLNKYRKRLSRFKKDKIFNIKEELYITLKL